MHRRWGFCLGVALGCGELAENSRNGRVRLEFGHNRTEMCFEVAEFELEFRVGAALGLIGCELRLAGHLAHALLISDAGALGHPLGGFLDTDDGEHQKLRAVLDRGLLILFESERNLSCHEEREFKKL